MVLGIISINAIIIMINNYMSYNDSYIYILTDDRDVTSNLIRLPKSTISALNTKRLKYATRAIC